MAAAAAAAAARQQQQQQQQQQGSSGSSSSKAAAAAARQQRQQQQQGSSGSMWVSTRETTCMQEFPDMSHSRQVLPCPEILENAGTRTPDLRSVPEAQYQSNSSGRADNLDGS
jgi:hypothetical protein